MKVVRPRTIQNSSIRPLFRLTRQIIALYSEGLVPPEKLAQTIKAWMR